jgi:hypothetical protein
MIWNVIDRRARPYRWRRINAIVEDVAHDNSCEDADQAPDDPESVTYDQREGISVEEAIAWAHQLAGRVTLFLYDEGDGTSSIDEDEIEQTAHFGVVSNDRF